MSQAAIHENAYRAFRDKIGKLCREYLGNKDVPSEMQIAVKAARKQLNQGLVVFQKHNGLYRPRGRKPTA